MKRKLYPLITFGVMLAIFVSSMALNAQNQATKLDANRTAIPDCECTITIVDVVDYELDCNELWPSNLTTTYTGEGADCNIPDPIILTSDEGVDGNTVGCTQSRIYTFTVMDECQKEWTETTTVYRVVDTEKPTITNCPDEVDLGCNPEPSEYEPSLIPDWLDNCEIVETGVRQGEVIDIGGCGYMMITHEYYAIDGCGNEATCDQMFTWKLDDVQPELSNLPDGGYIGCNPEELPSCDQNVTASDNCDSDVEVVCTPGEITGDDCNKTQIFNYYAIDECGNDVSVGVTYSWKIDLTDPVLSNVPSGGDLGCNPAELPSCDQNVTATDNCDGDLEVDCTPGEITGDCEKSQTITYSAIDACGNDVSADVIYTWKEDTENPTLTGVPDDITLNCNEEIPSPAEVSAEDNCPGLDLSFVQTTEEGDCENEYTITRTWTATDACGNETSDEQVITIIDDSAPEITCPDDLYLTCEDDIPELGTATANDNCDEDVLVEYLGEVQNGNPPDAYSITRTWRATDNCENSITCDQIIYVEACEQEGCTYTQGYWKTHSNKGPAPYDPAWGNLGDIDGDGDAEEEDEDFYYSGQTYYEVFWTPVGGNPYYILAHQFIAAHLNFLNGADPSAAQAEFDIAEALFNNPSNTPDEIKKLKKEAKKVWTDPAGILDDYNNGDIGPGHCDDEGDRSADELTGIINTQENVSISAYPNPFMNAVTIEFTMEEDTDVTLEVYNMTGAKVASLYNGDVQANQSYSFNFDGIAHVNQGTFIYVLRAGKTVKMGRLVMMK